jgi:outer membrane protein OmpA-like peptidoglycan-associated protein
VKAQSPGRSLGPQQLGIDCPNGPAALGRGERQQAPCAGSARLCDWQVADTRGTTPPPLLEETPMSGFKFNAMRRHLHGLIAAVLLAGSVTGCHFEARIGSSADAQDKKGNTKAAKSKKSKAKADEKDAAGKKADASSDDKKPPDTSADTKESKKSEPKADEKTDEPAATPAKAPVTLPGNLVFEAGKSTLKDGSGSQEVLASLKAYLEQQPRVTLLRLEGHSDNAASPADNLRISGERALTVKQWLVGKGIAESRLIAVGFGEKKPIADNSTEEGRAQNRRVEFKIAKINDKPYLGNDPLGGGTEFK